MTEVCRYPVAPETVTVLGSRWKASDPAWRGLDFTKAEVRTQSTIMVAFFGEDAPHDLHLRVPFCHPNDQPDGWENGLFYRVRPRAEAGRKWHGRKVTDVAIEPDPAADPPWQIVVHFAGRANNG